LSVPYCLFVKDPRKGFLLFLLEASLLEGPWKVFTYGLNLKLLVYIVRDLLLYATFLNFYANRSRVLEPELLRQRIPHIGLITLFIANIAIQIFNPNGYSLLNSVAGSRLFWEMIPLYWIGFYLMRDKKYFRILFWVCVFIVIFNSIAAILQYNWGLERTSEIANGYRVMLYEWRRDYQGTIRPPALGPDMGFAGYFFSEIIAMFIALFFIVLKFTNETYKRRTVLIFLIFAALVSISGLIVSLARSALVLTIIFTLTYLWLLRKAFNKKFIRASIFVGIILFLSTSFLSGKFEAGTERFESVKNPKELIETILHTEGGRFIQAFIVPFSHATQFFMGNGMGKVGSGAGLFSKGEACQINAENDLNLSLAEIGFIGTMIWIIFHFVIIKEGLGIFKRLHNTQWQWYLAVPLSYIITLLTFWQFGHLTLFPQNSGFWFMSGVIMAFRHIEDE
ncbi:MAG: hypothetical protein JW946_00675, partial [Candidatus Omnitrophica bacterium]|nr:hypothetical protein [Candidatus Omnitrophota bacterium]